jgi:hypothetical protein|tara:strand:+ start:12445 stop:12675 length:231 start_codon:yes stop_codon:yes gene_type:complete
MSKKLTQKEQILTHLKKYGSITSWDAIMEYGVTRLSHHIYCLRNEGFIIPDNRIQVETRLGRTTKISKYTLRDEKN